MRIVRYFGAVMTRPWLPRAVAVAASMLVVGLIGAEARDWYVDGAPPSVAASSPPAADPTVLPPPPPFDLSGGKALTVFWVLGFLEEYMGRQATDESAVVERLYCNEHGQLERFRAMLRRLSREQRLPDDLREEIVQECLVFLSSEALARGLNSIYVSRMRPGMFTIADGRRQEIAVLEVTHAMFERFGNDERIAYLAGAYFRHERDGAFVLANAAHKADLIAVLLAEIGMTSIERQTYYAIPSTNIVRFAEPDKLRALFAQVVQ